MREFGRRLRILREDAGLRQYQLAMKINASPASVSTWECNKCEPSMETLVEIAQLFGVSTDYLLGMTDRKR